MIVANGLPKLAAIRRAAFVALILALAAPGCGPAKTTATVHGHVTYQGKPVSIATLTFFPTSGASVPTTVGQDGAYKVELSPGDYQATVVVGVQLPAGWKEGDPMPPQPMTVPAKYGTRVRTPLRATVAADQTEAIDFKLE